MPPRTGSPNKVNVRELLRVQGEIEEARRKGKKLGRDVLDDFMTVCAGGAAFYQPRPDKETGAEQNPHANKDEFWKYAQFAYDCAKALAPYQSPTFRAIVVAPAPDPKQGEKVTRFGLKVFEGGRLIQENGQTIEGEVVADEAKE